MRSRQAIGYVVQIDGVDITLNLMDVHRGQLAAHAHGVSVVTEVGSLLGIESGGRLLVMKVQSLSFAEPKEVHRFGLGNIGCFRAIASSHRFGGGSAAA